MPNLVCGRCGYKTNRISNYKTHLTKKKPCKAIYADIDRGILLAQLKTPEGKNACKTLVVVPTTMTKEEAEGIEDKETFILQMHEDNVKLKHENAALKNANAELTSKLQTLQTSGGAASVTNNNTNNINITHIHINNYGKENTDYITDHFLAKTIETVYHSVPTLLKYIHFNPDHPENHNVRMPNKRDKYMQVRRNGEWKHENRKEVIGDLVSRGHIYMDSNVSDDILAHVPQNVQKCIRDYMKKMDDEDDEVVSDVCERVEVMLLDVRQEAA